VLLPQHLDLALVGRDRREPVPGASHGFDRVDTADVEATGPRVRGTGTVHAGLSCGSPSRRNSAIATVASKISAAP
jgi:hypothetical protein